MVKCYHRTIDVRKTIKSWEMCDSFLGEGEEGVSAAYKFKSGV